IPSPFDPRLILRIAPAVARAAMESGVASRPITSFEEYRAQLERFAFRSGLVMKPVFAEAKTQPVRVIYAEGEDERVLHATQVVLEEKLARPILVGRPSVVEARMKRYGLAIKAGRDFDLVNPEDDPRYRSYVQSYIDAAGRHGVTPDAEIGRASCRERVWISVLAPAADINRSCLMDDCRATPHTIWPRARLAPDLR